MIKILKQRKEFLKNYPHLAEQINDFADLAIAEIEDGGSPENELYLFTDSVEQIIKEDLITKTN